MLGRFCCLSTRAEVCFADFKYLVNVIQWNPREVNTLEVNSRLKSTPHGGPDFFLLCLSNFISLTKSTTSGRFSVKVNTTWPKERESEIKKRTNKGPDSGFVLLPNSVESPQQSLDCLLWPGGS